MIPIAEPLLGKDELKNIKEAIESGWVSSKGKFIKEFEDNFSKFCDVKFGVTTSSGTTALHLALSALGIKSGDEVIVPDLTFIATANTVVYCNAKPTFIDVHPDYWCLDPEKITEKITPKTKAIIPVHLYGHPCDMDIIMEIAEENNLYVIEDAAEAHGSEYKGKKVGSIGHVSCYSFFANKVITTGEGGMCLTDNEELAEKMKLLRDHGMNHEKRYWYDIIGFNYRMTNLQAALGVAQLTKIDKFINKKRQIANWYYKGLIDLADQELITLQPEKKWAKSIYWMYSILLNEKLGISRERFLETLKNNGIDNRPFFYAIHLLPPYKCSNSTLMVAEDISSRGLNLPSSTVLEEKDIKYINKIIKKIVDEVKK